MDVSSSPACMSVWSSVVMAAAVLARCHALLVGYRAMTGPSTLASCTTLRSTKLPPCPLTRTSLVMPDCRSDWRTSLMTECSVGEEMLTVPGHARCSCEHDTVMGGRYRTG